jgi:hypothetical protein
MTRTRPPIPDLTKDLDIDEGLADLLAAHEPNTRKLAALSDMDLLTITGSLRRAADVREELERIGL